MEWMGMKWEREGEWIENGHVSLVYGMESYVYRVFL